MADQIIPADNGTSVPSVDDHLPLWRRRGWIEDPDLVLEMRLSELAGLASCVSVLGSAAAGALDDELTDDALPMLGWVMRHLAEDAMRAKDQLERDRQGATQGGVR
jgi:hypothetical protein